MNHHKISRLSLVFFLVAVTAAGSLPGESKSTTSQPEYRLPHPLYTAQAGKMRDQVLAETGKNPIFKAWLFHTKHDATSYRITYATQYRGREITVSGAILLPHDLSAPRPLLVFLHGTSFARDNVPSMWTSPNPYLLPAMSGFITLLPDYIGYGYAGKGILHPYMQQRPDVRSVIDGIQAARQILAAHGIKLRKELFETRPFFFSKWFTSVLCFI